MRVVVLPSISVSMTLAYLHKYNISHDCIRHPRSEFEFIRAVNNKPNNFVCIENGIL